MKMHYRFLPALLGSTLFALSWTYSVAEDLRPDLPPLQPEPLGIVAKLPEKYPLNWLFVHDAAFMHMLDGRMLVIDPLADSIAGQHKGMFNISFMGHFVQATTRSEMYVAELFYSRGVRGKRTDVITIYDLATLEPVDEIVIPYEKRFSGMPERYALTLIDNERLLLLFNLTPATSVTVIDIVERKVVNEVDIPGCALIYPGGERGFSSLCSNGGLLSIQLDASGQVVSQQRVAPFFNTDTSPIFERPAIINGIAYFPGFDGSIHPVDLRGAVAVPGDPWTPVSASEQQQGWRPGGIGLIDSDSAGNFYLIMHPDGQESSQQGGGTEVWVINPQTKQRLRRIALKTWGLSLAVTRDQTPTLAVTNADLTLDIYNALSGEYIRTIADAGLETPLMLYGVR